MNQNDILRFSLKGVTIYRDLMEDPVLAKLRKLTGKQFQSAEQVAEIYAEMFCELASSPFCGNLTDYVYDLVLHAENLFTLSCARGGFESLPALLTGAARSDLQALSLLAHTPAAELKAHLADCFPDYAALIAKLPDYETGHSRFAFDGWDDLRALAESVTQRGYGRFGRWRSFTFECELGEAELIPITHPDEITLADLKGYERERGTILENTEALMRGVRANNILLYGDRGTGKSSTVKAIVNALAPRGLRLVEVAKHNLRHLGRLIDRLAGVPMKFIVFADDLSFSESDDSYTALKAVLEGSSNKLPDNMVIYATSNRRHLIQETFSSRGDDEVHLGDTLDETVSLSDRFGITVTFTTPKKAEFMEIVRQLAADHGLSLPVDTLESGANSWATRRGSFSPRTAKQYVNYLLARENGQS
ncbi:ATP-binding protein [Feifania hominis]|uniref:ATP-binding protein n=1 Tax=Feifania hominis TaxID=2763660 RepID=A0A926DD66_9FIRM|nr:ATP-binding protein [Feifania hominis]MBC8535154.1 ATP-binding protein [Feifania hominis]